MAEAPDEPLIDPSPPPEEKRRNWRVRRLVFYGFLGVWAMVFLGVTILGASLILGKKLGALFRV